ncbi:M48 family metalloprotease [Methylobacterium sp. J-092]|uniref:M48 family metalloprotease n=1 Tax=Methylobacterium sp. J-092 TaxID=2836667 RepID=UPI00391B426A
MIGHELAHFSGEDSAYSRRFTPIYAGLQRALAALGGCGVGNFLTRPASYVAYRSLGTLDAAVARWSRVREFEADRRGALVSGTVPAASNVPRLRWPTYAAGRVRMLPTPEPPSAASARCRPA